MTVSRDELLKAIDNVYGKESYSEDDSKNICDFILSFFGGHEDYIMDDVLSADEREFFYDLEDHGIVTRHREEINTDGKSWRINQWCLDKANIEKLAKDEKKYNIRAPIKDIDFHHIKKYYEKETKKLVNRIHKKPLNIVLLGSKDDGRPNIKKSLEQRFGEVTIIVPEEDFPIMPDEDFPKNYPYDIMKFEKFLFSNVEINRIFANISGSGVTFEYGNFYEFSKISKKLMLCINYEYHHLYSVNSSMLTNSYVYFDIKYGHVYPIKDEKGNNNFKTFEQLVTFFISHLVNDKNYSNL